MNRAVIGSAIFGFILGSFVMFLIIKTTPKEPSVITDSQKYSSQSHHNMQSMSVDLSHLSGDEFDRAFLTGMIEHHRGALDMAKQAKTQAKHNELKIMADNIISAQQSEIAQMEKWQKEWRY